MDKKLLIVATHSFDEPERAGAALAIANTAVANGMDIVIFTINEGVLLAKKGFPETIKEQKAFPPVKDLVASLVENEQKFYVCTPCAQQFDVKPEDMIPNAEQAGAQTLLELAMEREVMTF